MAGFMCVYACMSVLLCLPLPYIILFFCVCVCFACVAELPVLLFYTRICNMFCFLSVIFWFLFTCSLRLTSVSFSEIQRSHSLHFRYHSVACFPYLRVLTFVIFHLLSGVVLFNHQNIMCTILTITQFVYLSWVQCPLRQALVVQVGLWGKVLAPSGERIQILLVSYLWDFIQEKLLRKTTRFKVFGRTVFFSDPPLGGGLCIQSLGGGWAEIEDPYWKYGRTTELRRLIKG